MPLAKKFERLLENNIAVLGLDFYFERKSASS